MYGLLGVLEGVYGDGPRPGLVDAGIAAEYLAPMRRTDAAARLCRNEVATANAAPLVIAGCGRSGTTYLQAVLDASPEIFIPTESLFIADYLRAGNVLPRGLRRWLLYHEPQLRSWSDERSLPVDNLAVTIRDLHQRAAAAEGARIWGQKTPRFVRHIDVFRQAFPGCRFILIHRDPRAVVASMLQSPRHTYSVARACQRWNRDNQPILAARRQPSPDVMLVAYEALIQDYDEYLVRLFTFAGVKPLTRAEVTACGRVREFRGTGFGIAENNVRGGLDPNPANVDNWKKRLTVSQVRQIERLCGATMRELGYEPLSAADAEQLPVESGGRWRAWLSPLMDVRIVWAYLRYWPYYPVHHLLRRAAICCFSLVRRPAVSTTAGTLGLPGQ